MDQASVLARFLDTEGYRQTRANIFASKTSLDWYCRSRRERLIKAGALAMLNGRLMVDPQAFDAVVLEEGRAKLLEAA